MIITATMTAKNQVTIPKAVRDLLALKKSDTLEFIINEDNSVTVQRKPQVSDNNLWDIVAQQEAKYGSYDTPAIDWGEDVGTEQID